MEVVIKERTLPLSLGQTASGRVCFDSVVAATNSIVLQKQVQKGDLLIGINDENVERMNLQMCTALLSTSIRPLRCTFARPIVAVLSKSGPLGLSFDTFEGRVYVNAKPSGQARIAGNIKKGMLLMDIQSSNVAKTPLATALNLLKNAGRPLYLTFVVASSSAGNLQFLLTKAKAASPPRQPRSGRSAPPKTPAGPRPRKREFSGPPKTPAGKKTVIRSSAPKTPAGPRPNKSRDLGNVSKKTTTIPGPSSKSSPGVVVPAAPPKNQAGIVIPGPPPKNQSGIVIPGPPPKNQSGIVIPGPPPKNQSGIAVVDNGGRPDPKPRPTKKPPKPTARPTRKKQKEEEEEKKMKEEGKIIIIMIELYISSRFLFIHKSLSLSLSLPPNETS
jgi:hypothetical protein